MTELTAALAGAALGGVLAFLAAEWGIRRTERVAEAEKVRQEIAVLEGLIFETEIAEDLAEGRHATALPVAYLNAAIPLHHSMGAEQLDALRTYSNAVLRYNGRVIRLIEYGGGKRASGQSPGAEKVDTHASLVQQAAPVARDKLRELADSRKQRLNKRRVA